MTTVAQSISAQVKRPTDLACRYGGEEFAVILPDTALEGACMLAEKIRTAVFHLALPHETSQVAPVVSLSLGVATHKGQLQNVAELIKLADSLLYRAKELGRNRLEASS